MIVSNMCPKNGFICPDDAPFWQAAKTDEICDLGHTMYGVDYFSDRFTLYIS